MIPAAGDKAWKDLLRRLGTQKFQSKILGNFCLPGAAGRQYQEMRAMKSDAELLRDYRRRGDETAFRLLVERHAGLVQGAALRRTGDVELAREAAQQVFVLLAKNAGRLYAGTGLAGWLHRTAVLVSASIKRREEKRGRIMKRYEDHVLLTGTPGAATWTEALPLVDEGLTRLPEEDRR